MDRLKIGRQVRCTLSVVEREINRENVSAHMPLGVYVQSGLLTPESD